MLAFVNRALNRLVVELPEAMWRTLGMLFFGGCIAHKIIVRPTYASQLLWFVETGVFIIIVLSYASREPASVKARGAAEIVMPLIGAVWPFLLLSTPRGDFGLRHQASLVAIMTVGTAFALWSYVHLRRSFSILVEARAVVTSGPYRWMRHPIYAGQILTAAAVLGWRFSWFNLCVFAAFVAIQVWRARLEERKLSDAFPEYDRYRHRCITNLT